ncbi:MAG: peptidylprolyl isomerase [Ignavibacteriales bacterium]|nr:peptidylprolyl isomerase [Ignavibacteriales bacterium]
MKNCSKHLSSLNNFAVIICIGCFSFTGCSKKETPDKYVVKVNDAVLTEEQIKSALSQESNRGKYRSEFIHDWIENEILYQQAAKEGILEEKKFNSIVEQSKKEIAAALFINKLLSENKIEPTEDELRKYYEANKEEFRLTDDLFRFNIAYLNDFNTAIQFRNMAIENSWNSSLNKYRMESSIISYQSGQLYKKYQLQPTSLLRSVAGLQKDEVSLVIETEPSKFAVVQLTEKLDKDTIPSFDDSKEEVRERLTMIKRKDFLRLYIDKLIEDHNLEIKRYSE